jgi:hypothetical protein
MTKEKNALFSGEGAFNEENMIQQSSVATLDMGSVVERQKNEPVQSSLYHREKKTGFNYEKLHPKMKQKYDLDHKFVKGRFLNHESMSGQIEFHMGPWEEIQTHVMVDGGTYIIRKYIADYINNNCRLTQYSESPVEISPGVRKYVPLLTGGKQRFNFMIEEFIN